MIEKEKKQFKVGLAPMEGVSDFPYRLWAYLVSNPDFCSTPFFRVTEGCHQGNIPRRWFPEALDDRIQLPYQVIPQLMGSSTDVINDISSKLTTLVPFVDINFGCPSKRVVGKGSGSSLLRDLDSFYEFLGNLQDSNLPYSIKIRTGYDHDNLYQEMIDGISQFKFEQLTIHGRTKVQSYRGQANWQLIQDGCRVPFSVNGSGDILGYETLQEKLKIAPDVSGVIIGRAVSRQPWIFQEIREKALVQIDAELIPYVIATFAIINSLFLEEYEKLISMINKGMFHQPLLNDKELWCEFMTILIGEVFDQDISLDQIELSTKGLGRVKLLWHNLRTSLPELFFDPTILRSKNFADLIQKIQGKVTDYHQEFGKTKISMYPREKYHWLFSGESKPK